MSIGMAVYLVFRLIVQVALTALWIWGIILASGFWSTFFAVLIPVWGYVLIALHLTGAA